MTKLFKSVFWRSWVKQLLFNSESSFVFGFSFSYFRETNFNVFLGRDKRAPIAALRQAKFYPFRQPRQPQSMIGSWIAAAAIHELNYNLMDCSSWIVAIAYIGSYLQNLLPQSTSCCNPRDGTRGLRHLVDCGGSAAGVRRRNISPFIWSPEIFHKFWFIRGTSQNKLDPVVMTLAVGKNWTYNKLDNEITFTGRAAWHEMANML